MPQVLFNEKVAGRRAAVVQYFIGSGKEDIHLLYSLGREHGPEIIRDGIGPPRMALIDRPWETTTNPWLQRIGTWFINKKLKDAFITEKEFGKKIEGLVPSTEIKTLVEDLENTDDYFSYFKSCYGKEEKIIGLQSYGDLTMNLWHVAFVNLPCSSKPPKLIYLGGEPIDNRIYTCLVKWRQGNQSRKKVSIEYLRFSRFNYDTNSNDPRVVRIADSEEPIADKIEFATYGQLVIRDGIVIKPREIVHQFSDIRHLLLLPNLNPKGPLFKDEKEYLDEGGKRYYFGYEREDDVWFGESQLLADRNLRRAALTGAIELSRLYPGASEEQIKAALKFRTVREGNKFKPQPLYEEGPSPPNPLEQSQWRFVMEDRSLVEVYLKPNIYPCSILGVTNQGDVVCFAWRGSYTAPPGYTILQDTLINRMEVTSAAKKILAETVGLTDAILLDEGDDVRHEAFDPDVKLWRDLVVDEGNREQVRAVFLFSKKIEE